jgi:hypothetical protein
MRILIILAGHEMSSDFLHKIRKLADYVELLRNSTEVDIACISSFDDFSDYDRLLNFKYKVVNPKKQLSKVCDFLSSIPNDYSWYIKTRPDIEFMDPINFSKLLPGHINARVRVYRGRKKLKYGASVGAGSYAAHKDSISIGFIERMILDDQVYIFDYSLKPIFTPFEYNPELYENEWFHAQYWREKNVQFNMIALNVVFSNSKVYVPSGNVN